MLGVSSRKRRKRGILFTSAKSLKRNRMVRTRRSSEERCDNTDVAKVFNYNDEGQENQLECIPETQAGEAPTVKLMMPQGAMTWTTVRRTR